MCSMEKKVFPQFSDWYYLTCLGYSFKLEKTGEKGKDSDHGLAQEFYLHEGNKENNEKLSHHDHWSPDLGSSLGLNHIWFLRNQVINFNRWQKTAIKMLDSGCVNYKTIYFYSRFEFLQQW